MEQGKLFYDDPKEAINLAISNSGKRFKEVAHELWPHMKMDSAYARLKNSLREDKDEKLDWSEIIHICRITGCYDPIFYACDELYLTRPEPRAPDDEDAKLQREFIQAVSHLKKIEERMVRNAERVPELRRVG